MHRTEDVANRSVNRDRCRSEWRVHLGPAEAQHSDRRAEPLELELPVAENTLRQQDDVRARYLSYNMPLKSGRYKVGENVMPRNDRI